MKTTELPCNPCQSTGKRHKSHGKDLKCPLCMGAGKYWVDEKGKRYYGKKP